LTTKISNIVFREQVTNIPNLKGTGAVNADDIRPDAGRRGFDIDYDEECRFVRIEARNPLTEKDQPVCVPMENVKSFRIVGDKNKSKTERAIEFKAEDEAAAAKVKK
jgi:hypothetical protein